MISFQEKFKIGIKAGVQKGWSGFIWMLKILIPISFLTVLLDYSGALNAIDFILKPIMGLLNLPSIAALPLIVGMLTGIYGGIGVMIMLPLSKAHMTLIAVFLLISHNLIQEGVVQGKSGMHPLKGTLFRLAASILTVVIMSWFIDTSASENTTISIALSSAKPFFEVLKNWGVAMFYLSIKIFIIIMVLMILLSMMKIFNLIDSIIGILSPVLKFMGLNRNVGLLWLTASVFGLAYGAAVIVEEAGEGKIDPHDLTKLHISIGINHSMVEDPTLFLPLGLSPFWLWIPRLITALAFVHIFNLWHRIRQIQHQSGNP